MYEGKDTIVMFDKLAYEDLLPVRWVAQPRAVEKSAEDHFRPYWMAVPTGTTRVDFRGSDWYAGSWMVRDPAIWSQTVPLPPPSSDSTVTRSRPPPTA